MAGGEEVSKRGAELSHSPRLAGGDGFTPGKPGAM
jgi:hypothetical protein